jgi:CubicO group peptidase (beta-lactamase class C family)
MSAYDAARRVVERAIASRVFPAATIDVGDGGESLWADAVGTLTFEPSAPAAATDTPFDLASLTKPIATTTVVMELVRTGALSLDARVADFFDDWRGADREGVTVRDLLEHASGLPARLVDPPPDTRREFEHDICVMPLEYAPRTQSIYSDLGFILLGFLAADGGGASLDALFDRMPFVHGVRPQADLEPAKVRRTDSARATSVKKPDATKVRLKPDATYLGFGLPAARRPFAAPTRPMDGDPRRGRTLAGEVHDNYAAALGGVAGHAGLFGTAAAVAAFARVVLRAARLKGSRSTLPEDARSHPPEGARPAPLEGARAFQASDPDPLSPELVRLFTAKSSVPGSSRALGWDTMLPTSSCGERMSPQAFGHVGFTGTSLWIDPGRDRYFVLLTNRVCGGGTLEEMRTVRRAFHDALADV